MELGTIIKQKRKEKDVTQTGLAKLAGISRTYLADVEANRYNPSVSTLQKIASALNVDTSYLLEPNREVNAKTIASLKKRIEYLENSFASNTSLDTKDVLKNLHKQIEQLEVLYSFDAEYMDNFYKVTMQTSEINEEQFLINKIECQIDELEKLKNQQVDVEEAMNLILSQKGLMLNGEFLSDSSKLAIANAIKMGLAYAEVERQKEKQDTKTNDSDKKSDKKARG